MSNKSQIKPLSKIIPGQKYWTFQPRYGKSAKIRFDYAKRASDNDNKARRQKFELALGLCFATKNDALQVKEKLIQSVNSRKKI